MISVSMMAITMVIVTIAITTATAAEIVGLHSKMNKVIGSNYTVNQF